MTEQETRRQLEDLRRQARGWRIDIAVAIACIQSPNYDDAIRILKEVLGGIDKLNQQSPP